MALTCFYIFARDYFDKKKNYIIVIGGYLGLSLAAQFLFHYSSKKNFSIWEFSKFENTSPQVQAYYATYLDLHDQQNFITMPI